jgi:hypothetical protein
MTDHATTRHALPRFTQRISLGALEVSPFCPGSEIPAIVISPVLENRLLRSSVWLAAAGSPGTTPQVEFVVSRERALWNTLCLLDVARDVFAAGSGRTGLRTKLRAERSRSVR